MAWLTIATGVYMCLWEVVRNWGNWQPWPGWVIDYVAAAMLLAGAGWALRPPGRRSIGLMCGAWGFLVCLVYASFRGNLANIDSDNWGPIPQRPYTYLVGVYLACVIAGFLACLWSCRPRSP